MLSNFSSIAWRETQRAFVTNAVAWLFATDFSWGIRAFRLNTLWTVHLECWTLPQLPDAFPLWNSQMERAFGFKLISLIGDAKDRVLLVSSGSEGVVLSKQTGNVVWRFPLGHIETEKEAARRNRKYGMRLDTTDPALYFGASVFSYDDQSGLLACGAFFDKRVRVISISPPEHVVFEANTDVNPVMPRGGWWRVNRVAFASAGRYLIAGYTFGGRGTKLIVQSTEVFDTRTWKCVWKEEDLKTESVALSEDGRLLAYVRDNGIEIMPFYPQNP
jgi:hypothetical protein